ncbi:hypothetical protein GE09DRAFT_1261294 [Coniochaeta sp. 2T2.1]|nr:hypothetical protein GE09DRAFT_1261294 [Coniochaeta sp. 2T2.1]
MCGGNGLDGGEGDQRGQAESPPGGAPVGGGEQAGGSYEVALEVGDPPNASDSIRSSDDDSDSDGEHSSGSQADNGDEATVPADPSLYYHNIGREYVPRLRWTQEYDSATSRNYISSLHPAQGITAGTTETTRKLGHSPVAPYRLKPPVPLDLKRGDRLLEEFGSVGYWERLLAESPGVEDAAESFRHSEDAEDNAKSFRHFEDDEDEVMVFFSDPGFTEAQYYYRGRRIPRLAWTEHESHGQTYVTSLHPPQGTTAGEPGMYAVPTSTPLPHWKYKWQYIPVSSADLRIQLENLIIYNNFPYVEQDPSDQPGTSSPTGGRGGETDADNQYFYEGCRVPRLAWERYFHPLIAKWCCSTVRPPPGIKAGLAFDGKLHGSATPLREYWPANAQYYDGTMADPKMLGILHVHKGLLFFKVQGRGPPCVESQLVP